MEHFSANQKLCLIVIEAFAVFMTVFLTQMITTVFPAYSSVMVQPNTAANQSQAESRAAPATNCSVEDPDNVYVSILIGAKYCTEIVLFPIAGWVSDKYHPPLVLLCGALVEALVCIVYSASGNFYSTIFARSLDAIGYAVVSTAGLTIVYSLYGSERARNKVITVDSVLVYVAASISPYVAGSFYEHFKQRSELAARVATFMWILPLFLLLALGMLPFAFPRSWVARIVLGGRVTSSVCGACCSRKPSGGGSRKTSDDNHGGANGQCLQNRILVPDSVLNQQSLEQQLINQRASLAQLDTECESLARPGEAACVSPTQLDAQCVSPEAQQGAASATEGRRSPDCGSDAPPHTRESAHADKECATQRRTQTDQQQNCTPTSGTQTGEESAPTSGTQTGEESAPTSGTQTDQTKAPTSGTQTGHASESPPPHTHKSAAAAAPSPIKVEVVQPVSMTQLLRDPHVLVALVSLLCNGLTNNSLETTIPIFMIRRFCSSQQQQGVVFLFGFLSLVGFSSSSLLFHRHPAVSWCLPMCGLLVSGGLCVALAFSQPWWTVGVCIGLLSFTSAITEVILIPVIPKIIDAKYSLSYGSASGLTLLTFTVSGLIGTFPVGALVQHCGFLTLCALLCALNCVCAPFLVLLRRFFT